jgi:hypothetical protein
MTGRTILPRRRIFIACEGESERGYGALLQRLCDARGLPVHLVLPVLRGGSPRAMASNAAREADKEHRKVALAARFVLLDRDRLADAPEEEATTLRIVTQAAITPIWQAPDHEGFLLRHFSGHERDDPPRTQAVTALQKIWSDYRKPMAARDLERKLTPDHIRRAAAVTPGLPDLLAVLGLTP